MQGSLTVMEIVMEEASDKKRGRFTLMLKLQYVARRRAFKWFIGHMFKVLLNMSQNVKTKIDL
jgi:hypothetical protein